MCRSLQIFPETRGNPGEQELPDNCLSERTSESSESTRPCLNGPGINHHSQFFWCRHNIGGSRAGSSWSSVQSLRRRYSIGNTFASVSVNSETRSNIAYAIIIPMGSENPEVNTVKPNAQTAPTTRCQAVMKIDT
eukprot:IDg13017t1